MTPRFKRALWYLGISLIVYNVLSVGYSYLSFHGYRDKIIRELIKTAKSLRTHEEAINTDLVIEMPAPELGVAPPAPPPNTTLISVDNDRGFVWLTNHQSGKLRRYFRWSPSSGVTSQYDLNTDPELRETDFDVRSIVETEKGIIFFGTQKKSDNEIFVFVTRKEKVYILKRVAERHTPFLLPLRDGSILMAGGITNNSDKTQKFTNAIERINIDTKRISIEPLPNLPGNPRRDISWVELNDGRVMALGGTESQYVGSSPMSAESYLLDLAKKSWQAGPRMLKARSGASATVLPDNTVLVAGGWTPEETWNDAPSRSTERWDTHSVVFAPDLPLPIGIANHKAQWIQLDKAKHLLLSGGWLAAHNGNEAVFALDQNNKLWNMAALKCISGNDAIPLPYNGKPYMWCSAAFNEKDLVTLQLSGDKPGTVQLSSDSNGIVLHRTGIAFLPLDTDFPALAIGGRIENADSALVDAIWLDGRMQSLAPLNHARRNAKVFRLRDGSILVFGGSAGDSSRRTLHVPPIELLPFNPAIEKARWIDVEFNAGDISSLGLLKDGSLLAVHSSGKVERLTIVVSPERIAVQRSPLPSLNRPRIELPYGVSTGIKIKELADGRIIVAGGFTQYHRMALMHDDVDKDDAPDHFTYLGELSPSHNYEIYDPKSRRWSESATSGTDCAAPVILNDGRVVKWGGYGAIDPWDQVAITSPHPEQDAALEISSSDGMGWNPLKEKEAPPLVVSNVTHHPAVPFAIQGELFLSGTRPTDVTEYYWRGNEMVLWYNSADARWETLWEAGPTDNKNYRTNLGRIIMRDLPNGKRIALPVSGVTGTIGGD